jgi:hypothetical protein
MRILALGLVLLAGCSKSSTEEPTTTPEQPTGEQPPAGEEPPATGTERPALSAAQCEEQGGKVVGDIGDGAIHRPEYRCPDSGEAPIGSVTADPGGPVAIEGSVCCK